MALSGSSPGGVLSRGGRESIPIIDRNVTFQGASATRKPSRVPPRPVASSGRKVSALVVAIVMFGSFMAVLMAYSGPMADWTPYSPIFIGSDAEFESSGFPGAGTEENPYIIEGLEISGDETEGIFIDSTTVHFVIRDVHVTGATGSVSVGVKLTYVVNALIQECVFDNLQYGIWCADSDYAILSTNTFTSCVAPITVKWAEYCEVLDNTMDGYPGSWNGIFIGDASCCDVSGNSVTAFDFEGIYGYAAHDCTFSSNTVSDCGGAGLYLDFSSGDCVIHDNTFTNNDDYWGRGGGVHLDDCTGIQVYHNSFYGNTPEQAYDYRVTGNSWSLASPIGGNYWDDYTGGDVAPADGFGDIPYYIHGGAQDALPLMEPPGSTPIPEFTSIVVPVLVVMGLFLLIRRRQ